MPRPSKKLHLVETAAKLFCAHGYQTTGIDTILREAGVAKMTLYGNFKTKEDLILAALELLDKKGYEWLKNEMTCSHEEPTQRLQNVMRVIETFLFDSPFNGCPFIRASTEYPELEHEIHRFARSHKRKINDLFKDLCKEAHISAPEVTADHIQVIMEGAMTLVQLTGERKWIQLADRQLKILLKEQN